MHSRERRMWTLKGRPALLVVTLLLALLLPALPAHAVELFKVWRMPALNSI